jgi:hypothetical protein
MVKVCLKGICQNVQLTPENGQPVRCLIRVELDQNASRTYRLHDVQLLVPAEFATLLEVGRSVTVTSSKMETEAQPQSKTTISSLRLKSRSKAPISLLAVHLHLLREAHLAHLAQRAQWGRIGPRF